jgi:dTMP kinase
LPAPGRFLTLEGGEGTGKSTQQTLLATALRTAGLDVVATREPGGTPGGDAIRNLLLAPSAQWSPLSEVMLHSAARREHLDRLIKPALARGAWVICDRYADSTMAYQGYGLGVDRTLVADAYRIVAGNLFPDLTFVLDLAVEAARLRRLDRKGSIDRYEAMEAGFHERVRQGFLEIAREAPQRCVVIEAGATAHAVTASILRSVAERLDFRT